MGMTREEMQTNAAVRESARQQKRIADALERIADQLDGSERHVPGTNNALQSPLDRLVNAVEGIESAAHQR